MSAVTCAVAGCEVIAVTRALCNRHYLRWRKYGDPLADKRRTIGVCGAHDCQRSAIARGLCILHYERVRKHGSTDVVARGGRPLKGAVPTWAAVHKRLERSRGRAAEFSCVDCSAAAAEWSYDNTDPDELHERIGRAKSLCAYSLDPDRYQPRCRRCHRLFDAAHAAASI